MGTFLIKLSPTVSIVLSFDSFDTNGIPPKSDQIRNRIVWKLLPISARTVSFHSTSMGAVAYISVDWSRFCVLLVLPQHTIMII